MSAVSDEAVQAYIAASDRVYNARGLRRNPADEIRAGLEAAAPHIAAQVVRDYAKALERRLNSAVRDGLSFEGIEAIGTVQRLNRLADDLTKGTAT